MISMRDDDKLIVKFMSGKFQGEASFELKQDQVWLPYHGICYLQHIKYSTSWDWLMPVVEKINKTVVSVYSDHEYIAQVCIYPSACEIILEETSGATENEQLFSIGKSSTIDAVYQSCVSFIKWSNWNCNNH